MMKALVCLGAAVVVAAALPLLTAIAPTRAEMLAMVVYETKAEESIRELRVEKTQRIREDGLAIIDLDPESEAYGKVIAKFPLPPGLAPHHQYYNPDRTKIYVTATLLPMLHVVDVTRVPYRIRRIDTPGCERLDTMVFSGDNATWWLTCIATGRVLVGDATTDTIIGEIVTPDFGPHGIGIHEGIDRIIVTETGAFSNLGEAILVVEASTGKILSRHKMSDRPSPSHAGPVEVLFIEDSEPPVAYVSVMFDGADKKGALWRVLWIPDTGIFEIGRTFEFASVGAGIPIAMGQSLDRKFLFASTSKPGHFNIFDIAGDPLNPSLVKSLPAGQGAHHVALSPDGRLAFVQNGILNLPGFSDGSITVVDLESLEVIDTIDTFKDAGYAINHILMLPDWYRTAGE